MKKTKSVSEVRGEAAHALMLLLAAFIWGMTFVSQSIGAGYVGTFTFLTGRCAVAILFLLVLLPASGKLNKTKIRIKGTSKKRILAVGSVCGVFLFGGSAAQQAGIAGSTTAKAGFISALYVVLVPVIGLFFGRKPNVKMWVSVALSITGLYFLCMTDGFQSIGISDLFLLLDALLFSFQIMAVNYASHLIDGIHLSLIQTAAEGILSAACMLLFENPTVPAVAHAMPAILFAGLMSSGVAYTLQIIGQRGVNPTAASLIMCLESVFSALGGWIFLGQTLAIRELFGCALMFGATVLSLTPALP